MLRSVGHFGVVGEKEFEEVAALLWEVQICCTW